MQIHWNYMRLSIKSAVNTNCFEKLFFPLLRWIWKFQITVNYIVVGTKHQGGSWQIEKGEKWIEINWAWAHKSPTTSFKFNFSLDLIETNQTFVRAEGKLLHRVFPSSNILHKKRQKKIIFLIKIFLFFSCWGIIMIHYGKMYMTETSLIQTDDSIFIFMYKNTSTNKFELLYWQVEDMFFNKNEKRKEKFHFPSWCNFSHIFSMFLCQHSWKRFQNWNENVEEISIWSWEDLHWINELLGVDIYLKNTTRTASLSRFQERWNFLHISFNLFISTLCLQRSCSWELGGLIWWILSTLLIVREISNDFCSFSKVFHKNLDF